jgi:hypothetical protein
MQQAIKDETMWLQHSATRVLQDKRLESIERTISDGQRAIMSTITAAGHTVLSSHFDTSQEINLSLDSSRDIDTLRHSRKRSNGKFSRKVSISFPSWFTDTVWEVGTFDMGHVTIRTLQLRYFNVRPRSSAAFGVVCSGNVETIRELLVTGDLSLQDHFSPEWSCDHAHSLLVVSAHHTYKFRPRLLTQV